MMQLSAVVTDVIQYDRPTPVKRIVWRHGRPYDTTVWKGGELTLELEIEAEPGWIVSETRCIQVSAERALQAIYALTGHDLTKERDEYGELL